MWISVIKCLLYQKEKEVQSEDISSGNVVKSLGDERLKSLAYHISVFDKTE